jgi:Fe-S oxidoreductase
LPPGYICCGYPSIASGDKARGDKISYDNRVLFHRLRNALSYLDFEAVVVSCGTCFDQLEQYDLEQTFPDAQLIDIHEYLLKEGVHVEDGNSGPYLYHEPCHTPLKYYGPRKVIKTLLNAETECPEQCCGEAGTLAVARPDISGKIRARKEEEIDKSKKLLDAKDNGKPKKILTSCPSCLQGLSRIEQVTGLKADYIVVELARLLKGENWQQEFLERVKGGGIEEVLM